MVSLNLIKLVSNVIAKMIINVVYYYNNLKNLNFNLKPPKQRVKVDIILYQNAYLHVGPPTNNLLVGMVWQVLFHRPNNLDI